MFMLNIKKTRLNARSRLPYPLLLALPVMLMPTSAQVFAAEISQPMEVRVEITTSCQIDTDSVDLAFGTHTNFGRPTTEPIEQTAEFKFTCNDGTAWNVTAGDGLYPEGEVRHMRHDSNGNSLAYELYSDSGHNTQFPRTPVEALASSNTNGVGTGEQATVTLYGKVPANTNLGPTGAYHDTVVLSLNF